MYKQIAENKRNTVLIFLGFIALISIIGGGFAYIYDDPSIMITSTIVALIYAAIQYFFSTQLAIMMTGAKKANRRDNRRLYNIVENLTITAGLPMPEVYIIDDPAPNAFATGRDPDHAVVAATTGLIDIMDDKELTAVMAHELSHVKNYDIRVSAIAFALVCVIGFLSDIGFRMMRYSRKNDKENSPVGLFMIIFTAIFAPLAASIAQMAVSREREYLADISAVEITRYPEGMISALKKLEEHSRPMARQNAATEAMFINSPLRKQAVNLFSTHPPIEKRIERLEHAKYSF
jgi:heat shock protein HtpX